MAKPSARSFRISYGHNDALVAHHVGITGGGGGLLTIGYILLLGTSRKYPLPSKNVGLADRTFATWKGIARPTEHIRCKPLVHPIAQDGDVSALMLTSESSIPPARLVESIDIPERYCIVGAESRIERGKLSE